jgi:hypothetical protein
LLDVLFLVGGTRKLYAPFATARGLEVHVGSDVSLWSLGVNRAMHADGLSAAVVIPAAATAAPAAPPLTAFARITKFIGDWVFWRRYRLTATASTAGAAASTKDATVPLVAKDAVRAGMQAVLEVERQPFVREVHDVTLLQRMAAVVGVHLSS